MIGFFRMWYKYQILKFVSMQEYDIVNDNSKNPKERLARQKQNLRRRLGLYCFPLSVFLLN